MEPDAKVGISDHLGTVMELTQSTGLRQIPVVDTDGRLAGFLDESDVTRAYLELLKSSVERSHSGTTRA
jgi:predicted transcriptional regulator